MYLRGSLGKASHRCEGSRHLTVLYLYNENKNNKGSSHPGARFRARHFATISFQTPWPRGCCFTNQSPTYLRAFALPEPSARSTLPSPLSSLCSKSNTNETLLDHPINPVLTPPSYPFFYAAFFSKILTSSSDTWHHFLICHIYCVFHFFH